jgi:FkbM family methyltransferase
LADKLGMLNTLVSYELPRGIVFTTPFSVVDNRWDAWDIQHYERPVITAMCSALQGLAGVTLFDCGADIGIFSVLLCASSDNLRRIFAFEPNPGVFEFLTRNLAALPVEAHAYQEALGNEVTHGALVSPGYDKSPHARFVCPGNGDLKVTTIDNIACTDRNIALKIDVEGSELEVLQGARRTIAGADNVAIVFEAHPDVARRTGRSPLACIRFLSDIRPFQFVVAETGATVSLDRPLEATDWTSNLNIVATGRLSKETASG